MADQSREVATTIDSVDEALLRAEAKARGVPFEQVISEKFAEGLDRVVGRFSGPDRPSRGRKQH